MNWPGTGHHHCHACENYLRLPPPPNCKPARGQHNFGATGLQQYDERHSAAGLECSTWIPSSDRCRFEPLVLVETIYRVSGSGTAGGGYFGPKVSYTWYGAGSVYYHQVWSQNHTPLIGDGTLERGRPVIRINYTPFTTSGLPCPPMLSYPLDGELRVHPTSILSWSSGGGWPTGYKLILPGPGSLHLRI